MSRRSRGLHQQISTHGAHGFCNARFSNGLAARNPSCHSVDAEILLHTREDNQADRRHRSHGADSAIHRDRLQHWLCQGSSPHLVPGFQLLGGCGAVNALGRQVLTLDTVRSLHWSGFVVGWRFVKPRSANPRRSPLTDKKTIVETVEASVEKAAESVADFVDKVAAPEEPLVVLPPEEEKAPEKPAS